MQIWDFNLGQLRSHDESGQLEIEYGAKNAGFAIKNFGELMKETSLTNTKMLGDMYQMNCSIAHDDVASFNVSSIDNSGFLAGISVKTFGRNFFGFLANLQCFSWCHKVFLGSVNALRIYSKYRRMFKNLIWDVHPCISSSGQ